MTATAKPVAHASRKKRWRAKLERLGRTRSSEHDGAIMAAGTTHVPTPNMIALRRRNMGDRSQTFTIWCGKTRLRSGSARRSREKFREASRHKVPMLSLDNAFSDEDAIEFVARNPPLPEADADAPVAMNGEPKIDGHVAVAALRGGPASFRRPRGGRERRGENVTAMRAAVADIPQMCWTQVFRHHTSARRSLHDPYAKFLAPETKRQQKGSASHLRQPRATRRLVRLRKLDFRRSPHRGR